MSSRLPHLSLPFRIVGDHAATTEQGTADEVADCVEVIVRCPLGFRIERPKFGLADQAFKEGGPSSAEILAAVRRHEPRADPDVITSIADDLVGTATLTTNGGA